MPEFVHEYEHRVRYRESDPMGLVYHAHYVDYFEAARTEAIRAAGISYKDIEDGGIFMPVLEVSVNYRRPAFYDDLLTIRTAVTLSETRTRVRFDYEVVRKEEAAILATGHVTLCFLDRARNRPVQAPEHIVSAMSRLREASRSSS